MRLLHAVRGSHGPSEDRLVAVEQPPALIAAVSDGAGSSGGGAMAAEFVVAFVRREVPQLVSTWATSQLVALLGRLDLELVRSRLAGEATCILVVLSCGVICGASVGDSQAWLFADGEPLILKSGQNRKPLLGSGRAAPVGFGAVPFAGRLVLALDGLFNYCPPRRLPTLATRKPIDAVPGESKCSRALLGPLASSM